MVGAMGPQQAPPPRAGVKPPHAPAQRLERTITALGAQGDGIAERGGRTIYVPFTVPGDKVRARLTGSDRAQAVEWVERGPDRVEPPCPHFGRCGGCALQHVAD